MKYTLVSFLLLIVIFSCSEDPVRFSQVALDEVFVDLDESKVSFGEILESNRGKKIMIDVWASWCKDCLEGIPTIKQLQVLHPEIEFVFLSQDRTMQGWKNGIERYNIKGQHYFMPNGWDSPFTDFIDLDWIPRYIVVDEAGKISLFEATKTDDNRLIEALK